MDKAVRWEDYYYDDGERVVLTKKEIGIKGLQVFGRHYLNKAVTALVPHYHHNCFELTYIKKGNVIFQVDGKEYRLSGGDIFVTYPNETHSTGDVPMSTNEMYWLQLDVSEINNFLLLGNSWAKNLINEMYQLRNRVIKTDNREMDYLMRDFFSLVYKQDKVRIYEAIGLLVVFLHRALYYDKQIKFSFTPDICRAAEFVLNNICEDIQLEDLANTSGLSLSRFKQKFKLQLGVTPREFVNFHKIEQAKTMILDGKTVTETAMELGFSSSNYFSVVFKKFTSLSPTAYVKKHKK